MAKRKKRVSLKNTAPLLEIIEEGRNGGAIALAGFEYQCLYSCYALFVLLKTEADNLRFEGIEDVDSYRATYDGTRQINHIQLKTSQNKQDASFMLSVLKNFLEVYLSDVVKNRTYTLVYDFEIAKGNLSKLVDGKLDGSAHDYWKGIIISICKENSLWSWESLDVDKFLASLRFERRSIAQLTDDICKCLIQDYGVTTGNEAQFVRALFYHCFVQMRARMKTTKADLDREIQQIKDDIDRGATNPAQKWIYPVDFDSITGSRDSSYFAGKKAEFSDIVANLPIRRVGLEQQIRESIRDNIITVIKSSSGQGKTTAAFQVAYTLRSTYSVYILNWCADGRDISHIVDYIKSRVKIGQYPLIVLDNLDVDTQKWNQLAQSLYEQMGSRYKILLTVREEDWHAYSGDQSQLRGVNLIHLQLDEQEAKSIFDRLYVEKRIHPSIANWQTAWEQVKDQRLLIEYIFLLTQGEMLAVRVEQQLKIAAISSENFKIDVLHRICLADMFGISLSVDKLSEYFHQRYNNNILPALGSIEREFSIFQRDGRIISGLHRVRSEHVVRVLDRGMSKQETILALVEMIDNVYVSKLYANLPRYITSEKENVYSKLAERNAGLSYEYNVQATRGLYSGSVNHYFMLNKNIFDKANEHGGLFLFAMEIGPHSVYSKFDIKIRTMEELYKLQPDNTNLKYLIDLTRSVDPFQVTAADYYLYAFHLHQQMQSYPIRAIKNGFSALVYWLIITNIDFCLIDSKMMEKIWSSLEFWLMQDIAELMLCWYLADERAYREFIDVHKEKILQYLKEQTGSIRLYEDASDNSIHLEYLLMLEDISSANQLSVDRLEAICRMLPIYSVYCSQGVRLSIDAFNFVNHDDSVKHIPLQNLVLGFNKAFNEIWTNTITSNYECLTIFEWVDFWISIRKKIVRFCEMVIDILQKKLRASSISKSVLGQFDDLRNEITHDLVIEKPYPRSRRPFETPPDFDENKMDLKRYFSNVKNFMNQAVPFILKQERMANLFLYNLRQARYELSEMQSSFEAVSAQSGGDLEELNHICEKEASIFNRLLTTAEYYLSHDRVPNFHSHLAELWVSSQRSAELKEMETLLCETEYLRHKMIFPTKMLIEGNMSTLPLIIVDIDILNPTDMASTLFSLSPLKTCSVDRVILMFCIPKTNVIRTNAIWISKQYIDTMFEMLQNGDPDSPENPSLTPPLPHETSMSYLMCFAQSFEIEKNMTASWLEGVLQLCQLLWKFAKQRTFLNTDKDQSFLQKLQTETEFDIRRLLMTIKDSAPLTVYTRVETVANSTLANGDDFTDERANLLYESLVMEAIS